MGPNATPTDQGRVKDIAANGKSASEGAGVASRLKELLGKARGSCRKRQLQWTPDECRLDESRLAGEMGQALVTCRIETPREAIFAVCSAISLAPACALSARVRWRGRRTGR